jgi:hypothetical protein
MASLALLLVTLWLMSKGKAYLWTFIPFIFMFVTTIGALIYKAYEAFFLLLTAEGRPKSDRQIIIGIVAFPSSRRSSGLGSLKAFQRYEPKWRASAKQGDLVRRGSRLPSRT